MAICKKCNTIIPDGEEYCSKCLEEEKHRNESYLDSLLSSVQNSSPDVDELYKKNNVDDMDTKEKPRTEDDKEQKSLQAQSDDHMADMEDFADLFKTLDMDDDLNTAELGNAEGDYAEGKDNATEAKLSQHEEAAALDTGSDQKESEEEEKPEEDILKLLNEIPADDPISQEAKAISGLLSEQADKAEDIPTVGEVFSDSLKVVNSLDDPETAAEADTDAKKAKKEKKKAKKQEKKELKEKERLAKKEKKKKAKEQAKTEAGEIVPAEKQSQQKKKSILQRLFGNVHDEKASAESNKTRYTAAEDGTKANKKEKVKEKSSLLSRFFKHKKPDNKEEEDELEIQAGRRAVNAEKRRNAKEEKKEKKRKKKEIVKVIDEIEEDEGRINRVGAGIVFCFFGVLALLVFFGTDKVSYSLSIRHATDYFERQKYNEAYNEISGIEPKDEDREIYDRIITVMYVNKQLNSYNNYYYLGMYPQALDSLLKGIERYDKYIEYATMLGIKNDLNYVKGQILAELENVFNLTEDDVKQLMDIEDADEYSQRIYKVVQERMDN